MFTLNRLNKLEKTFIYVFFIFSFSLSAQNAISGQVKNKNETPIEGSSVIIKTVNDDIIAFGYTNKDGFFSINNIPRNKELILLINSLGFEQYLVRFKLNENLESFNILLLEKPFELNEVVLSPEQKISSNSNVTTIKTKYFTDKTEQTIEDVLKKIPGVEVLEDGSIKAHGKFISKLLIEGDDVFANNYQILSKNLDAKALDAVEIIDAFQDNPVLAKVVDSDLVALNLKLNKNFKNIWFGNTTLGAGTQERVKLSLNLGLLRKKIKFFYFNNYNNLGLKASNQLNTSPASLNLSSFYQELRIEPEIEPLYTINKNETTLLNKGESIFNKALINSIGFVTKLAPKLELRGTGTYTIDDQNQDFFAETKFNINTEPIVITENSYTKHNNKIGSGELELKYTGGKKSYLKNILVYNNKPEYFKNKIIYNDTIISQNLKQKNFSFYNHLNHTYAINKNNVIHNYVFFGQNRINQNINLQSPIFNRVFSFSEDHNINYISNDNVKEFGLSSNLFSVFGKFKHNLKLKYESVNERRTNNFINETTLDSLKNNLNYKTDKLIIASYLSYSISKKVKLSLGGSLNHLKIDNEDQQEQEWVFNPELRLDLRKLKMGLMRISYKNTFDLPQSNYFLNNCQLNSYRSFSKGLDSIILVKKKNISIYYKWANKLESQAFTVQLKHNTSKKSYSMSNEIGEDFIFSNYNIYNGSSNFSADINFTSYLKKLNLSTNLRTTQTWSVTPFQINNEESKNLKSHLSSYLFSGTTYFNYPVNLTFRVNINKNSSHFNNVLSETHWENVVLKLNYSVNKVYSLALNNNMYTTQNGSYYFLNPEINYQPVNSKFSFQLIANNLTGEKNFSNVLVSDYTVYNSSIKLLPLYILGIIKYRF